MSASRTPTKACWPRLAWRVRSDADLTKRLHLLGLDHTKLTYRFNGRDMRLTDVYGDLIPQIMG